MQDQWDILTKELRKQGHQVLPEYAGFYPVGDETRYRQSLTADLSKADLFIQLLGDNPGKKPVGSDINVVQLQAEAAKSEVGRRNLTLLSWREPDTDLVKIKNDGLKALLSAAPAVDFNLFCRQIIERLATKPAQSVSIDSVGLLSVVINADETDRELGEQIQQILYDLKVEVTLVEDPKIVNDPTHYMNGLKRLLEANHGVLIVYGQAPVQWVRSQKAEATKILYMRKGVWGALLNGPPAEKVNHGIMSHVVMDLDCRSGLRHDHLKRFVDTLREENLRHRG